LDTTDAWTIAGDGDSDVAHFSPGTGPGVSHDVVIFATLRSIADCGNSMIEFGAALRGIEDTIEYIWNTLWSASTVTEIGALAMAAFNWAVELAGTLTKEATSTVPSDAS